MCENVGTYLGDMGKGYLMKFVPSIQMEQSYLIFNNNNKMWINNYIMRDRLFSQKTLDLYENTGVFAF
jgi:hypothetical protein